MKLLLAFLGLDLVSADGATSSSVTSIIEDLEEFSIFRKGLESTKLQLELVDNSASFNIFAPTNEAMMEIPDVYYDNQYHRHLREILKYHIEPKGNGGGPLTIHTMLNQEDTVSLQEGENSKQIGPCYSGGLTGIGTSYNATNGVVHTLDNVLSPSFLRTSIDEVVVERGLDKIKYYLMGVDQGVSHGVTLLAPTNEAIRKFETKYAHLRRDEDALREIFANHVLQGIYTMHELNTETGNLLGELKISQDRATDILASDGMVHEVDFVLVPQKFSQQLPQLNPMMDSRVSSVKFFPVLAGVGVLVSRLARYTRRNAMRK